MQLLSLADAQVGHIHRPQVLQCASVLVLSVLNRIDTIQVRVNVCVF